MTVNRMGYPCTVVKDPKDESSLICRIHTPDLKPWFVKLRADGTFCHNAKSGYDLIDYKCPLIKESDGE